MKYLNTSEATKFVDAQYDPVVGDLLSCLYGAWMHPEVITAAEVGESIECIPDTFDALFFFRAFVDAVAAWRSGGAIPAGGAEKLDIRRRAEAEKVLENVQLPEARGIMHAFSETVEMVSYRPAVDFDLHFAFLLLAKGLDNPRTLPIALAGQLSNPEYWL